MYISAIERVQQEKNQINVIIKSMNFDQTNHFYQNHEKTKRSEEDDRIFKKLLFCFLPFYHFSFYSILICEFKLHIIFLYPSYLVFYAYPFLYFYFLCFIYLSLFVLFFWLRFHFV